MAVGQNGEGDNHVGQQDGDHGPGQVHAPGDKAGGQVIGGYADVHANPQREKAVDPPVALLRLGGQEIGGDFCVAEIQILHTNFLPSASSLVSFRPLGAALFCGCLALAVPSSLPQYAVLSSNRLHAEKKLLSQPFFRWPAFTFRQ